MRKYPFVRQQGIKECGVACILMIIRYYKGNISLSRLLDMTKTNKDGTTLYHIVNALTEIGFDCDGIKCELDDLLNKNIIMPCISSVIINSSYKHFVVIYEIKKNYIIIGDPAYGIKKVCISQFRKIYNNAIVIATPNKTIPYVNDKKYFTLYKIIIKNKKLIKLIIIYSFVITLLSILNSLYFGRLIDSLNTNKNILFCVFIIFFSITLLKIIIDFIKNKMLIYLNKIIDLSLTQDIFSKILSLPYKYYKNHSTGDLVSRITDLFYLKEFLNKIIIAIFIDMPLILVSLILLYVINKSLFFFCFLIFILNLIVVFIFNNINFKKNYKLKNLYSTFNSYMVESINGFETIKGLNIKNIINQKFSNKYLDFLNYQFLVNKFYLKQVVIKNIINNLGVIVINYLGIILVYDDKLKLSSLITFNTIFSYFTNSINSIIDVTININEFRTNLNRINEIMVNNNDTGFLNYFTNGDIRYRNLTYTFDDKRYVLKNINLLIKKEEKVLIIGKSGSGKSTLFKLLKKYYDVDMDLVFINNIDINNFKYSAINNSILYINQSEIIFNDSVLNNIKLKEIEDEKLLLISKLCFVDEIVNKNNLGYNLLLEENGFNLSGGERQRIILARTLLCDFDILIIDEGLNQVDIILERKILKNVFEYFKDKTIIVISHRIDNYKLFDHIIELKEGVITKDVKRKSK